jgi:hypothetical protein
MTSGIKHFTFSMLLTTLASASTLEQTKLNASLLIITNHILSSQPTEVLPPSEPPEVLPPSKPRNSRSIQRKTWEYYTLDTNKSSNINIKLKNLSEDCDLYIQESSLPTHENYQYLSENHGIEDEEINIYIHSNSTLYIGIYGFPTDYNRDNSFNYSLDILVNDIRVIPLLFKS